MAIKVQWGPDGAFAICDTPAEAMELLKQPRNGSGSSREQSHAQQSQNEKLTLEQKAGAVIEGINDKARNFLKTLLRYPQGIEGEDFGKVCGTEPAGFGGVMGGISKEAKKVGLTIDDFVESEARFEGNRRFRWLEPAEVLMEFKDKLK